MVGEDATEAVSAVVARSGQGSDEEDGFGASSILSTISCAFKH